MKKAEESSHLPVGLEPQRSRALKLLESDRMVRLRDFAAHGIWPETLARLVREEVVVRRSRGLYQLSDARVEVTHAFAEAAALVPKGVICLISALQFHDLTLHTPSAIWMAVDRKAWRPKIKYPPVRFVRWNATPHGISHHRIEGVNVQITNISRTIVDCFRYRNKVGIDVAIYGLRQALQSRRCTADELMQYAQKSRGWSVMRPYVEAVMSDEW
jgi:predicted transcriptional regulator of viral defense system